MKRGVLMGDIHAGHLMGLTPPAWQAKGDGWRAKVRKTQKQMWDWFDKQIGALPKLDFLVHNGDAVEGDGQRSGGTELVAQDPLVQAEIASYTIQRMMSRNTKLYMTYGTPSHTGVLFDTENLIANDCNAESIEGQLFLDIEGIVFDIKHKVGSSGVPHGRATAVKKAQLWNRLWADADEQPRSDFLVRSHVHYHQAAYDPDSGWAMTLPALQGMGSKYGARQCEGRVHFGFVYVEIDDGTVNWTPHVAKLAIHKSKAIKV